MHGEVGDLDLLGIGPEDRRNLRVDARHILRPGGAAGGLRAEIDREDRRGLTIGGEKNAVGSKRQRSDRLKRLGRGGLGLSGYDSPRGRHGHGETSRLPTSTPMFSKIYGAFSDPPDE